MIVKLVSNTRLKQYQVSFYYFIKFTILPNHRFTFESKKKFFLLVMEMVRTRKRFWSQLFDVKSQLF